MSDRELVLFLIDVLGVGAVAGLATSLVMISARVKDGLGVVLGIAFGLIGFLAIASCASVPVRADDGSRERCEGLIALACNHDARCGGDPMEVCFVEQSGTCAAVYGLTQTETDGCAIGLVQAQCDGAYPEACYGIFGYAEPAESPQPTVLTL